MPTPRNLHLRTYLQILFGILILWAIAWYVQFQARNFLEGPQITLQPEPATLHTDRTVTIAGHTENIVSLSLNGRTINTDAEGYFYEQLVLENGYTIMTLEAKDRYGRITHVVRPFVHTEES